MTEYFRSVCRFLSYTFPEIGKPLLDFATVLGKRGLRRGGGGALRNPLGVYYHDVRLRFVAGV